MKFKFYKQLDMMDCGPTCLRMICKHYGREYSLRLLANLCEINRNGISLLGLNIAAQKLGFETVAAKIDGLHLREAELPCILHWRQNHFIVLYKIKNDKYHLADPASGVIILQEKDFNENWTKNSAASEGIALLLVPTAQFFEQKKELSGKIQWSIVTRYFVSYRKLFIQLLVALGLGSLIQLVVPFLTQSIVDIGIANKSVHFIYVILIAQAVLIVSRITVEYFRAWILLHVSTRVNISILSDFLIKLMKLPISFFDTKMTGDIIQRMEDQKRIETFLTGSTLSVIFSGISVFILSIVLAYYDIRIFCVFIVTSLLYNLWIFRFLERRRLLNYKNFEISSRNQNSIVQLINGMQEIKLNNYERLKRWEWENIQAKLFSFNIKSLALSQYQQGGAFFINEGGNLLVTFLSAKNVVEGHMTLGAMMAVLYIIGQLNAPIQQLLAFIQSYQDAKISLERLNEIHQMENEEPETQQFFKRLPAKRDISINNISFKYPGAGNIAVLNDVNIFIPEGKTTALVGMSGSGKTTLLKLLLRFYEAGSGEILIGDIPLNSLSFETWRSECGVVMQDGFIFSDTLLQNIVTADEHPDPDKLKHAIEVANIRDFIDNLPMGLETQIGADGNGISQGQRQRILIARAVYKDPNYIFFDEATNALDANNEKIVMDNLKKFFQDSTVIVVAHRLSTVNNADNIIVIHQGRVVEQGSHRQLTKLKGSYYELVKNQLELGT